jgi:hypothetical protein
VVESEIEAATGYHPSMSCCQSAKDHVEHRISRAVEEEREACARVAEDGYLLPLTVWQDTRKHLVAEFARRVAEAIRSRSVDKE